MGRARGGVAAAQASRRGYSEETLRLELDVFTADREDWPAYPELRAAGRADLAYAISVNGGPARWAAELGKHLPAEQTKNPRRWSEAEIESQLRAFVGHADVFPTREQFSAAGRYQLYMAARRYGGIEHWRTRLAMPANQRPRWSDAELDEALREFIADRPEWPSQAEFKKSGHLGLLLAVQRRGGVVRWADRLGKSLSPRQRAAVGKAGV